MERLTKPGENNGLNYVWGRNCVNGSFDIWDEELLEKQIDRLASYEGTGLTPEEIMGLCEMDKRSKMAKMLRWEEADEEGRLAVLPCKVGATVWAVTSPTNITGELFPEEQLAIFDCTVESISLRSHFDAQIRLYYRGNFVAWYVTAADIGKSVFMSIEEAEAALKERMGEE